MGWVARLLPSSLSMSSVGRAMTDLAEEEGECTLIAGSFDKFIQFLLACLSLTVLVVKRVREHPRRPLPVWLMDTSKQTIGAGIAHLANLVISIHFAREGNSDECATYLLAFILDTTVGVFISYVFLLGVQRLARRIGEPCAPIMRTGYYGDTPSLRVWVLQVITWCLIIVATKVAIALLMLVLWHALTVVAGVLDAVFRHHRKVELIMVMIIAPTFLNAVQFWIQDNFLMDERDFERLPLMKIDTSRSNGPRRRTGSHGAQAAGNAAGMMAGVGSAAPATVLTPTGSAVSVKRTD